MSYLDGVYEHVGRGKLEEAILSVLPLGCRPAISTLQCKLTFTAVKVYCTIAAAVRFKPG